MKRSILTLSCKFLLILLFVGCNEKSISSHYETGEIKEEFQCTADSVKNGYYKKYAPNGVLIETANYLNGKLNGERNLYNTDTGTKEISEIYKADALEGRYIVYHPNGEIQSLAVYKDNKLSGALKFYDTSGLFVNEFQYVDNIEVIPFKEYHENGNIKWEGTKSYDHYFGIKKDFGVLKEYNEDGVLIRKIDCDENEICTTIWAIDGSHLKK